MASHPVTFWRAQCDVCGYIEDDYGDFSAWNDPSWAIDAVLDAGWFQRDGTAKLVCPACQHCDVCGAAEAHPIDDDHLVCDQHEDHQFIKGLT